ELCAAPAGEVAFVHAGVRQRYGVTFRGDALVIASGNQTHEFRDATYDAPAPVEVAGSGRVVAPMDGVIIELGPPPGAPVNKGDTLLVLEAMKMQLRLAADISGSVKQVFVERGASVRLGQLLVELGE
ncbi:MAG TPA: biotin/lipoyl-containing protein, partial [Polyangiaceae bacterium]|nr:biotin/lipoyl-containing protein [Polyangiaceae bacterium]